MQDTISAKRSRPVESVEGAGSRLARRRAVLLSMVLLVAVAAGLALAARDPDTAAAFFTRTMAAMAAVTPVQTKRPAAAPPARARPSLPADFTETLFEAVDADDAAAVRVLMATRPGALVLDEVALFVDDRWGAGPRGLVDYAVLGGHLRAADALLAAGATPSRRLLALVAAYAGVERLRRARALLIASDAAPGIAAPGIAATR